MTGSGSKQKEKATNLLCIECREKFSTNYNLKQHIEHHHPEADVASPAALGSGLCQCQLCPFECCYVNALCQHRSEEHALTFWTERITFNSHSGEGKNFSVEVSNYY